MAYYARKKDANHEQICDLYRWYGWEVIDTSWSRGRMLDFIAINWRTRETRFVEVKNGKKKTTDEENKFITKYKDFCRVIHDQNEALKDARNG